MTPDSRPIPSPPAIIAAVAADGALGRNGSLIWHIPGDLRRFKALTLAHPVVMGRKTWDSLPKRPLPGRPNIVVTRNAAFQAPGATVVSSPEEALETARKLSPHTPFIIGGEQIYRAFLPLAATLHLTQIDASCPDADAWLPFPPDPRRWTLREASPWQGDNPRFRFLTYENRTHQ